MTRMDRYVLAETLLPFVSGVFLIMVMLVGNTLYPLIQQIAEYRIPVMVIAKLVAFNLPVVFVLTLPAGQALAAAWSVNRLARDSEVTAIRMSGVPLRRLFLPIFVMGVCTSLLGVFIYNRVAPGAYRQFQQTQNQMGAYAMQALPSIASDKVFTFENYSFYIHQIASDPKDSAKLHLSGVTIYQSHPENQFPTLITAQSAIYDRDVWTFYGVHSIYLNAAGSVIYELAGTQATLDLSVPLNSFAQSAAEAPDSETMQELGTQMQALGRLGQRGTDTYNAIAFSYYSKLALPCICFVFALCAPPLALRFSRHGAYTGILLSILLVWVAWNTLLLGKFLGLSGRIPPAFAAWAPDALFLALGIALLVRAE